jgi:phenylacetate-coenzyme A ligase PaaK-like adenylate-forming protein
MPLMMSAPVATAIPGVETLDQRLRRVVAAHFHPVWGTPYWLDRARQLRIDARRELRTIGDLDLLGEMTPLDLRRRPLLDYVPRRMHERLDQLVIAQTGGTTAGGGTWTAYHDDEFVEAFVLPFVAAAGALGFPPREQWLFIGPSGPHVIGKVVRHLAAALGSPEPFAVDFDPRWAKKLPDGSFARQRYLGHLIEQAMLVIERQDVGVLFTTPPVLEALAAVMSPAQRARLRAVHYGGLPISPREMRRFQTDLFPAAVHLSGYGNTLFGCAMELSTRPAREIDYFPFGNRLLFETVCDDGAATASGEPGQVRFTRLDETMLLVRLRERDHAVRIEPPPAGAPAEFVLPGLRNPRTPAAAATAATAEPIATGLY